jgi:Flp pilus assembly protein TadG
MVEFAIVLPLFLMVLTVVVELGKLFMDYSELGDVARSGARKAVVSRTAGDPTGAAVASARAAAGGLDQSKLTVGVASSWTPGEPVTVTATYPWTLNIVGLPVASGALTQTTTMRME